MDPYIEFSGRWADFHLGMLAAMRGQLNERLPRRYYASGDRHVWLLQSPSAGRPKVREPDVFLTDRGENGPAQGGGTALAAPAIVTLPAVRRQGNRYLKIVDKEHQRVVTVIEMLSPTNKASDANGQAYRAKRDEYLAAGTNLVEIDLLRRGKRMPLGKPRPVKADYYVFVCRAWEMPTAGVWPISLRDQLPEVPIPLDADKPDVPLSLRVCLDRAYEEGRYAVVLPYDEPLKPSPAEADAAWLRKVLAKRSDGD
jgi:hypothetical protein